MSLFDDERENQDDLSSDGASSLTLSWSAEDSVEDLADGSAADLGDDVAADSAEDLGDDMAADLGDDVAVGVAGMAEAPEEPAAPSRMKLVPPGALMVFLLKNYIDREDDKQLFESLVRQEREVEEFCRRLFLRLVVDHESGYAYVRSLTEEELPQNAGQRPPQLLTKRALPFYDSMVLILLRQRLLEFELSGQFGRLVLERAEILTMVKTFVHNVNNDKRLDDNLNKAIDNLCSLGLLGKNKSAAASSTKKADRNMERIEVKRIISVIVTPEILKQADEILASYVKHIKEGGRAKNKLSSTDDE